MSMLLPDPMLPVPMRIKRAQKENYNTFTLELEPVEKEFRFAPGQFNMLYVFGMGESAISISGDPTKPEKLIHTIREVGAVTSAMRKLRAGDFIGVRGPFGSSWPVEEALGNDVLIITGGIGLAPLRPVIYHTLNNRDRYGKVVILYGARTPEDILYLKELEQWKGRFDLDVFVTVDSAMKGWRGNVGFVTKLISKASFDPHNTTAMICGPEVMMRFTVMELRHCGLKDEDIFVTMERNMKCAIGFCGHCQYGPTFMCKDGPVYRYNQVQRLMDIREV